MLRVYHFNHPDNKEKVNLNSQEMVAQETTKFIIQSNLQKEQFQSKEVQNFSATNLPVYSGDLTDKNIIDPHGKDQP